MPVLSRPCSNPSYAGYFIQFPGIFRPAPLKMNHFQTPVSLDDPADRQ